MNAEEGDKTVGVKYAWLLIYSFHALLIASLSFLLSVQTFVDIFFLFLQQVGRLGLFLCGRGYSPCAGMRFATI